LFLGPGAIVGSGSFLVIGTGEAWLTELSTTELKKLFTLSREAIGD